MNASALQHRILALANQVGPADEGEGTFASLHALGSEQVAHLRNHVAPAPVLCLVLEGRRSLSRAGRREVFRPGQLLLVPAGFAVDLVDEPCPESGRFRAVALSFSERGIARFREEHDDEPRRLPGESSLRVELDEHMAASLCGALETLLDPERHGRILTERKLLEVLMRLKQQGRLPDLIGIEGRDLEWQLRELVRLNPAEAWTPERVAPLLGVSEPELEAALATTGGLDTVVEDERMGQAQRLMDEGGVSLADVAYSCGYASPEFFASRLRAWREAASLRVV